MIILINILLIFISIISYFFRFRCISLVVLIISMFLFFSVGTGILPNFLLNNLQTKYKHNNIDFKTNNLIILLGAGLQSVDEIKEPSFFSYSRLNSSVKVYNMCLKQNINCKIVISGYEANTYLKNLLDMGIKIENIILEDKSKNTFQNAEFTKKIIDKNKFNNIILVTSGFHMFRSELYFSHFGIKAMPYRSDYLQPIFTYIPLGYNFAITDFAINEYIGILRYYIYNILKLNSPKVAITNN